MNNNTDIIFENYGQYLEHEGVSLWRNTGTVKTVKDSLLRIEVRKYGNSFWRVVTIQNQPYDYSDSKIISVVDQLWRSVLENAVYRNEGT